EVLAGRLVAPPAGAALPARRRVRRDDPPPRRRLDAAELVPERARRRPEQYRVAARVRLRVGSVRQRDLDLHEDVALARLRPRNVLEPDVTGAVEDQRPHVL